MAAVALPIAGGVVGTALAGPVGFLAGAKLATLGAFTGSVLGMLYPHTNNCLF